MLGRAARNNLRNGVSARVLTLMFGIPLVTGASSAWAGNILPTSGHYVAGTGAIAKRGSSGLSINQSSATGIIDWSSFSIGKGNSVQFNNGVGATLNRVTGGNLSTIAGSLKATGSLYLINPQGVIVSGSGKVVTGGSFVASSRDESDVDFLGGKRKFSGASNGKVSNVGTIKSANGDVALIGSSVSNSGSMSAANGTASLNAGNQVLLAPAGSRILVSGGTGSASNSGTLAAAQAQINAAGGNVYALAGNNGGIVRATGTKSVDGHVWLTSGSGNLTVAGNVTATNADGSGGAVTTRANNIVVSGNIDASATKGTKSGGNVSIIAQDTTQFAGTIAAKGGDHGKGGLVETSGQYLKVADSAKVTTLAKDGLSGDWLIDPNDFTIAASGGDITGAQLSTNLGTTDVTIASGDGVNAGNGDIFINDAVSWSSAHSLTLNAQRNIDVNANVSITGSGALALNTGLGGGGDLDFTLGLGRVEFTNVTSGNNMALAINGQAYTLENTLADLATDIAASPSGFYALAGNYDASADGIYSGAPLSLTLLGTLEGLGNTISNVSASQNQSSFTLGGLIDAIGTPTDAGYVRDLQLKNMDLTLAGDNAFAGGLTSELINGTISNVAVSGVLTVTGSHQDVGGIVGDMDNGVIENSSSDMNLLVEGDNDIIGGLVGAGRGSFTGSFATGEIASKGNNDIGGFIGSLGAGSITTSYASGDISAEGEGGAVGGFAGVSFAGTTIDHSYATGNLSGGEVSYGGGFIGDNHGTIDHSYSTGNVSAGFVRGGFAGVNNGSIDESYETGTMGEGTGPAGGFVGQNDGTLGASVADYFKASSLSGSGTVFGGTGDAVGLTSAQMLDSANFVGWTFGITPGAPGWVVVDTDGSLNNNAGSGGTTPMLLTEYSTNIANAHQLQLANLDPSENYNLVADIDASRTESGGDVWGTAGFIPVGGNGSSSLLTGTFDGQGHTISWLYMNTDSTYVGLFGRATGTVENVGLLHAHINGGGHVGALAGSAEGAQITNVYDTGYVQGSSGDVGGLVGTLGNGSSISDSWTGIEVLGSGDNNGGLAGVIESGASITQSHADYFVAATGVAGGLAGRNSGTISFSYAAGAGVESDNSYAGGIAGTNTGTITDVYASEDLYGLHMGGLVGNNSGAVNNSFWNIDAVTSSGVSNFGTNSGTSSNIAGRSQAAMEKTSGFTGWSFGGLGSGANWVLIGEDGSVNNPNNKVGGTLPMLLSEYSTTITNTHQLQLMTLDLAQAYTLSTDVNATTFGRTDEGVWSEDGFVSVGGNNVSDTAFSGTFDGEGHTIDGLWMLQTGNDYIGLFGRTTADARIENVALTNQTIAYLGVSDIPAIGVGGLVGDNAGVISHVSVGGSIHLQGIMSAGGIAGINEGTISYSQSAENTGVSDDYDGGQGVGGLVGLNLGDISYSSASGGAGASSNNVGASAGGLVGLNSGAGHISFSSASGSVDGDSNAGGLVGALESGTVEHSFATGTVFSSQTGGGLVGFVGADAAVTTSYAGVDVVGIGFSVVAGGLVGDNEGTISQSYATGSADGEIAGGFVGINNGTISDAYATGSAFASNYGGGFVGQNNGVIDSAYSLGQGFEFGGTPILGGFAAFNTGTITSAYWDTDTSGISADFGGASGETSAQLKSALPDGFDSSVWSIVAGKSFAYLGWQFDGATPTVISGTVYSNSGTTKAPNQEIALQDAGGDLGTIVSYADGSFYKLASSLSSSGLMAVNSDSGGSAYSDTGDYTGMAIYGSGVRISTADTKFSTLLGNMNAATGLDDTFAQIAQSFGGSGTVTLAVNAANFDIDDALDAGTRTLSFTSTGSVSESGTGGISAGFLSGSSQGAVALGATTNAISKIGSFNTGGNAFSLTNSIALNVTGHVDTDSAALTLKTLSGGLTITSIVDGGAVTLQSVSTISEATNGRILATSISGSAAGNVTLTSSNNTISALGAFTRNGAGDFKLTDAHDLSLEGWLNYTGGNVTLNVTGTVTENGGVISATTLTGSSTGATTLGGNNHIAALGAFTQTGAGDFDLNDGQGLSLTGVLSINGNVTLDVGGTLSENGGSIAATEFGGSSFGAVTLTAANHIEKLSSFDNASTGGMSLTDAQSLTVLGDVNAGTTGDLAITVTGAGNSLNLFNGNFTVAGTATFVSPGSISQSLGSIDADQVTGSANGTVTLTGANEVNELGAFATNGHDLSLTNAADLSLAGDFDIGVANLTIRTTGTGNDLTIDHELKGQSITLRSDATITEVTGGLINTNTLNVSGGPTVALNAANLVNNLSGGAISGSDGAFSFTDASNLTVQNINAEKTIKIVTTGAGHNIDLAGSLWTFAFEQGGITLNSAGAISQDATGGSFINTFSLQGSSVGGASFVGTNNQAETLGAFTNTGGGDLTYNGNMGFNVTGDIDTGAGDISLATNAGTIAIEATISTTGALALSSTGYVENTSGGALDVGTLSVTAFNDVNLGFNHNVIGALGTISAGGLIFIANTKDLAIDCELSSNAVDIRTSSGGITINGAIAADATVNLTAAGRISEGAGGSISADTLSGSSDGAASLSQSGNIIGTLSGFTAGAGLSLFDAASLTVSGAVTPGTGGIVLKTIGAGHNLTINGPIGSAAHGMTLTSAGTISEGSSGVINTVSLTGSSAGLVTLNGANNIANLAAFSSGNGLLLNDAQSLTVSGAVTTGAGALVLSTTGAGHNMTVNAAIGSTAHSVKLTSAGYITQSGSGIINALALSGSSVGNTTLTASNNVTGLSGFTVSAGNFTLYDAQALSVSGTENLLSATATLALKTIAGDLSLNGILNAATVTFVTAGEAKQTSSSAITTNLINVTAKTGINLVGANHIQAVGRRSTTSGPNVINGIGM